MIYLSGCVRDSLPPEMGVLVTPNMGNRLPDDRVFAFDTGCFSAGKHFDPMAYLGLLARYQHAADRCLFATMPDVVGDAKATLASVRQWPAIIRALGYKPALVAQDGLTRDTVPWDDCDALFIGGTTAWKLSESASTLIREAKTLGKWTHVGRVNTRKRIWHVWQDQPDSIDGTFIAFGPDINVPRLSRWMRQATAQLPLEIPA